MSTTPCRRVLRTVALEAISAQRQQQRRHKQQARRSKERATFERWMQKLRRAFHTIERNQRDLPLGAGISPERVTPRPDDLLPIQETHHVATS